MPSSPHQLLAGLAGGLGLFMLGMQLMTEGLKLAAGQALRNILERSTSTPLRGLFSGALITSLVQSSSAVTVATIGFVNASLMNLGQAITVIYGSNIGTTVTGWLVALVGFQVDVKDFALPAVGVGMLWRLVRGGGSAGAPGEALAGFGVFFLGIEILKTAFDGLGQSVPLVELGGGGLVSVLIYLAIGFLLTLAMQSSSAAIAIVLTATVGGLLHLENAAAVVVGANIGTTSTAALAVVGATPNAKRVAAAHVAFNLVTGLVAVLILPLLLDGLLALRRVLGLDNNPAQVLALFHTTFNLLGVMLMWPLTPVMVRFLNKCFRTSEEDEARPRFLDRNIADTPVLAIHALARELARVGAIARRMAVAAIRGESGAGRQLETDYQVLLALENTISEFISLVRRKPLPPELDQVLPNALRVSGYYREVAEQARQIARLGHSGRALTGRELTAMVGRFQREVIGLLLEADIERPDYTVERLRKRKETLETEYKAVKARLLRAGTLGEIPVPQMVAQLERLSHIRRLADQAEKGARYLISLTAPADSALANPAEASDNAPDHNGTSPPPLS